MNKTSTDFTRKNTFVYLMLELLSWWRICMDVHKGKYNIKAISKMLGIQPGTLRAWERRYQFIAPDRNQSGHRLYTDEHLKILRWLVDKTRQGFTISQAVSLLERQELLQETNEIKFADYEQSKKLAAELLEALLNFDEGRSYELINHAFSLYSIEKVVIEILCSILHQIGDLWENGKITSAHEHFASSILRSRIGFIIQTLPHNQVLPKAVAVCGPNEWHEIGLLMFTLFLKRRGFDVVYLGQSLAPKDLSIVIQTVRPKFLFFSCTLEENVEGTITLIETLKNEFKSLEIGLGGNAMDTLPSDLKEKYASHLLGNEPSYWEKWLQERIS